VRPAENAAAALRGHRGHAGDRALLALAHVRDEGLAEVEHPIQVHGQDAAQVLGRDVHGLHRLGDAGIIDQDVDLTERLEHAPGCLLAGCRLDHVASEATMLGAVEP